MIKNLSLRLMTWSGSFFYVLLWSLQPVGTLRNLAGLQISITEEMTKTFRLNKILNKMTWKDMSRVPGLSLWRELDYQWIETYVPSFSNCLNKFLSHCWLHSVDHCDQFLITLRNFFNRDLNRGCLVYMFSLHFSGSKFLINLQRKFRVCL